MHITLLEVHAADGDFWVDVLAIGRFQSETASLFCISRCCDVWHIEFCYTKPLLNRWRDWLDGRNV